MAATGTRWGYVDLAQTRSSSFRSGFRHRNGGGSPKYDRNVDEQTSSSSGSVQRAACSERPTRPRLRCPGAGHDAPVASRLVKPTMQRKHLALREYGVATPESKESMHSTSKTT